MTDTPVRFHEILEARFRSTLKKFMGKNLTPTMLRLVRNAILSDVQRMFQASNVVLSARAMGWVTNQYYLRTGLNGEGIIAELVITNDHKLESFSDDDMRT